MLEHLIKIVIEVARARDSCGVMAYAMQRAADLGLRLSSVLPSGESAASTQPLPLEPPPAVKELFSSAVPCYMRVLSNGRTWSLPNPAFSEWIVTRGGGGSEYASFSPAKLLAFLESDRDRQRMLGLVSSALLAQLHPTADGASFGADARGDEPFNLAFNEGQ